MSIGQMDSERKDLATSGKITMTQNLTLYAMEGFTRDGRPLAQTADASQSYNWYAKPNLGIDDAKKMGGPAEKETVAAYQGLINAFKSVEV